MMEKTISHYRILEKVGSGGMGVVYKAEDTKLKRIVALKFLPQELTQDPEAKERFHQEARAAAGLDHLNICSVYEIDETEENQMFIAMAYYEGETLKEKIAKGPLKIDDAVEIALQVAEGLKEAHKHHIVHRDIKPANILITGNGIVKIVDFGLATSKGRSKLTKEGSTLGTASYMSPEQTMSDEIDSRTDIWSLGVVLYEMITGQLPFRGDYEQATVYSILNETPEPPTALRTGISMELERITVKAMAKKPEERYQYIDDAIVDLRNIKQDTKSDATHVSKITPEVRERKQRRFLPILGVILIVILLVTGGYFLFIGKNSGHAENQISKTETRWKNSIAVLPFVDMSPQKDQEYFCDGMTEDIITKLTRINELKVISRTSVMQYKHTKKNMKTIGQELGVKNVLEGSIRKEGDKIRVTAQLINIRDDSHLWADTFNRKVESIFDVQDEVSKDIAQALEVKYSQKKFSTQRPTNIEAYEYLLKAKHWTNSYILTKREEDFQKAVEMSQKAIDADPNDAILYGGVAWIYEVHHNITGNPEDRKLVIKNCLTAYRLNPNLSQTNAAMAWVYFTQGQNEKTAVHLKKALELNPNVSEINHTIGLILGRRGLFRKAVKYIQKARESNPLFLYSPLLLGSTYMNLGELDKALIYFKKCVELSPDDIDTLTLYANLLIMMKKTDEAKRVLSAAIAVNPQSQEVLSSKAYLHAAKGEKKEALAIVLTNDLNKGQLYALLGMKDEAMELISAGSDEFYLRLQNHSFYDNLRGDPRFNDVLEKLKKRYESLLKIYQDL